jgi:hypothetical protein
MLVFGELEDEIPALIEPLEDYEEKCENYVSAKDLIACEDCQKLFCLDCLEGGYCRDCSPIF